MRALELVKHCWCALNCTISTQKTKNVENHPELANVRCFPIAQDSEKKYYAAEMPERERRMRWIATVAWTVKMLQGTPEYVQYISKEVLAPLNWILFPQHSDSIIGENLRKVVLNPRSDVESSENKHHRPRGVWKCLLGAKKKKNKTLIPSKEEYSALEGANTPYCRPVYLDDEVPTDLTASEIEVSLMASSWAFTDKSKSFRDAYSRHWL